MVKQITMYQDSKGDYFRTEAEALQAEAVCAREQAVNSAKDKLLDTLKSDHTFDKLDDDRKIAGMVCAYPEPFYELARACLPERLDEHGASVEQQLRERLGFFGLERAIQAAESWQNVVNALDGVIPGWRYDGSGSLSESAVMAIEVLGERRTPEPLKVGDLVRARSDGSGRVVSIAARSVKVELLRSDVPAIQFFDIEDVTKI